jgi:hypothetical protein
MKMMTMMKRTRSIRGILAAGREIVPLVLCSILLLLASMGASAQTPVKSDPYGEPVPTVGGGVVLPDADNPADPAGTPVPPAPDKPAPLPPGISLVTTSGGHFAVDGHPFRHVGVNEVDYVYEGDPNTDLWNDTYTLRQGGIKQIRVILANDALSTPAILDDLDRALGVAWNRGIRVTVALTNFYYGTHYGHAGNGGHTAVAGDAHYYTDTCCGGIQLLNHAWIAGGYNDNYKPFVRAVVNRFAGDGRVFAWEIGNEIGAPNGDVEAAIAFYRDMALTIKGIDPGHMVTTGIICTQWLPLTTQDQKNRLYQYMDYVVEHHYDPNSPNPGDLSDNQLAAYLNKPLVIEEYGVNQHAWPYSADHNLIMPAVSDFFDWAYAAQPYKQADAVMVWGVDFGWDHGSGDANFGPWEQNLGNDYLQLWRETADWSRPTPRYVDVPPGDTFFGYIECLSNRRAVNGHFDWVDDQHNDEFRPGATVTRADAIKAIVRAMGFPLQFPANPTFTDVPRSSPYYRYIETAVAYGIISGYADHTFRPDAFLTRGQMCKVIVVAGIAKYGWQINTAGGPHFVDVPTDQTFYIYVETAFNRQIVSGYGSYFYPGNYTTRGQFAKMLSQAISCS